MRHLFFLACAAATLPLFAQSNTIPGSGSRLSDLTAPSSFGRIGTYPTGRNGFAAGVSVCNNGTVPINWLAAMNADHPMYAFMMCRETDGRFMQISDWSYCKHGFASINSDCGGCIQPPGGGTQLGVRCGDTYGAGLNADRYYLGPPSEIDPWLLVWNPIGSHFDRGEPDVGPPANTDGQRSLSFAMTQAMDGVKHLVEVDDADLLVPNSRFFIAGRVMTRGEIGSTRDDNMLSRVLTPNWSSSQWLFSNVGPMLSGSPLVQWTGALLRSAPNGSDDGEVYVGCKVTPLADGRWHYEYALHNRDNGRGIAGFRVPKCPSARVFAAGFRDIDRNGFNDWSVQVGANEVAFLAGAGNALEWNCIYNCWFDSDAAPDSGSITLDEARLGAGALQFQVQDVQSPLRLATEYLGNGCGAPTPELFAHGTPSLAAIPNASFALRLQATANSDAVLLFAFQPGNTALGNGCTSWLDGMTTAALGLWRTDAAGSVAASLPIPNDPALEGLDVLFQAAVRHQGGALYGQFDLSNALRVRIGNQRRGCP